MSNEMDLASKSKANPKLLYEYSQNSRKQKIRMLITSEGDHLVDGSDIDECLNNQYIDQFTIDDLTCTPPFFRV